MTLKELITELEKTLREHPDLADSEALSGEGDCTEVYVSDPHGVIDPATGLPLKKRLMVG